MGRLPLHLAFSLPKAPPVYVHPLRSRRPRRPLAWGEDAVRRHRKRLTPHQRKVAAAVKTYREHTHANHAALRAKAERARRGGPAPNASLAPLRRFFVHFSPCLQPVHAPLFIAHFFTFFSTCSRTLLLF